MDLQIVKIPIPIGGLNTRDRSSLTDMRYCPDMSNMFLGETIISKVLGYSQVLEDLEGAGMAVRQFIDGAGNYHHLAFTTKHVYKLNVSLLRWDIYNQQTSLDTMEDKADWTPSANVTLANETTTYKQGSGSMKMTISANFSDALLAYSNTPSAVDLTSARSSYVEEDYNAIAFWLYSNTAFDAGDLNIVLCEDANGARTGTYVEFTNPSAVEATTWYRVTITGDMSNLNAVESIGIYGTLDGSGTPINIYLDDLIAYRQYTGTDEDKWSTVVLNDANDPPAWNKATAIGATNNVDKPICWDGSDSCFEELHVNTTDFSGFNSTRIMDMHFNHIGFYNYSAGSPNVRGFRWGSIGKCYGTNVWDYGTSGEMILTNTRGAVLNVLPIGQDRVIYSERSLALQKYVGGTAIYVYDNITNEVGLFSQNAVYSTPLSHYFFGSDGKIYQYAGSREIVGIGKLIEKDLLKSIYTNKREFVMMGMDVIKKRVYLFYPDWKRGDSYPKSYFCLNLENNMPLWEKGRFDDYVMDMAEFDTLYDVLFTDPYYATRLFTSTLLAKRLYTSFEFRISHPLTMFITYGGKVCVLNDNTGQFDTTDISCYIDTPDIVADPASERIFGRFLEFSFSASSSRRSVTSYATVEYSTDSGSTWTELSDSPVTLTSEWTEHILELDVKARRIRFRISQDSNGDLQIADRRCKFAMGTDRV